MSCFRPQVLPSIALRLRQLLFSLALVPALGVAQPVTWQTPQTMTGQDSAVVLNNGVEHAAVGFTTQPVTVNGVTFTPLTQNGEVTSGSTRISMTTLLVDQKVTGGSGALGSLLSRANFHQNSSGKITLSGLTVGSQYQVQVFMPFWDLLWTSRFTSGTTPDLRVGAGTHPNPDMMVGTFTAQATELDVPFVPVGPWAGVAAVAVRDLGIPRVIDRFTVAYSAVTNGTLSSLRTVIGGGAGNFQYGDTTNSAITGGNREVSVRDGHSGSLSEGLVVAALDTAAGKLQTYGNASGGAVTLSYGSFVRTGFASGTPAPLNLGFRKGDHFTLDIAQLSDGFANQGITIELKSDAAGSASYPLQATAAGRFSIPLASFAGMTPQLAADIDGVRLSFSTRGSDAARGLHLTAVGFTDFPEPMRGNVTPQAGTSMLVQLIDGAPATSYLLRRSTDLKTWLPLKLVATDALGSASHNDTTAPAGKAFYVFKTPEFGAWTFFENHTNAGLAGRIDMLRATYTDKEWRYVPLNGSNSTIEFRDFK